jgi:hypothetical protein
MDLHEGVQLSVKIGIGVGEVAVLFLGGVFGRMESVAVGDPLIQAFESEHHGESGQVIVSKEVWKLLGKHYGFLREQKKYMTEVNRIECFQNSRKTCFFFLFFECLLNHVHIFVGSNKIIHHIIVGGWFCLGAL